MKPLKKSLAAAAVLFLAVCAYAAPVRHMGLPGFRFKESAEEDDPVGG